MKIRLLTLLAATAVTGSAMASSLDFTYNYAGQSPQIWGNSKAEAYDVAIKIQEPALVGAKIKGITVDVNSIPKNVSRSRAWLSKELKLISNQNVPDICTKSGSLDSESVLNITFDSPYTLTEDGVYVGYSFTVSTLDNYNKTPVTYVNGNNPNGLFVHTDKSQMQWTDMGSRLHGVSTIVVHMDADLPANSAAFVPTGSVYAAQDGSSDLLIPVSNYGTSEITSIDYTVSGTDYNTTGTYTFEAPVPAIFGATRDIALQLGQLPDLGTHPYTFTINKVNGQPNSAANASVTTDLNVLSFVPVKRPLVEEFTGLKCPWCPIGFVAMEQLALQHPDRFVGMAYHCAAYETGCMVCIPANKLPMSVNSFPSGSLDRYSLIHAGELLGSWDNYAQGLADAEITAEIEWADDNLSQITGHIDTRFVQGYDSHKYQITIGLVADGLKNSKWKQSNNLSHNSSYSDPIYSTFYNGGSSVGGLTFNDVVMWMPNSKGISGSLPEVIEADTKYTYNFEIPMSEAVNVKGEDILTPECTLRVVGIIVDTATRKVVNCVNSNKLAHTSGVGSITAPAEVLTTEWYDMQGRRIDNPDKGIFVRVKTLSDGSRRSDKVVR